MTPVPGVATLSQVKAAELVRNKQRAALFANPLGKACFELDKAQVRACLDDLRKHDLLEPGLVYVSEVRPLSDAQALSSKEWKAFQLEIGCQPLLMVCLACGRELERLRVEGAGAQKEKAVQMLAGEIIGLLVESGADPGLVDVGPLENTALHLAARYGAAKLISFLLSLGTNPTSLNADGCTAEVVASRCGQVLCQQILQVVVANMGNHADEELLDSSPSSRQQRKKWKARKQSRGRSDKQSEVEEVEINEDDEEMDGERKLREGRRIRGARYGPDGLWAMFDKDLARRQSNDESEFSSSEEGSDQDSLDGESAFLDHSEDELEGDMRTRNLVAKLREKCAKGRQHLQEMHAEQEAISDEMKRLRTTSTYLKERLQTFKNRLARATAGDKTAHEDMASDRDVCAWWEKKARQTSRKVQELVDTRKKQRQQMSAQIDGLEKEARQLARRTVGLEEYWDQFLDAERASEVIDLLAAEQRARQLEHEVRQLVRAPLDAAGLDAARRLQDLPRVFLPQEDGTRATLAPVAELVVAAEVHRRFVSASGEQNAELNEMVDLCNSKIAEKDDNIASLIEENIGEIAAKISQSQQVAKRARLAGQSLAGSNELVKSIKDASRIPVMGHADGICAVYVDSKADLEKAVKIVVDSKTHYCAACNSMETLLVHEDVVQSFLPKLAAALEGKEDVHYKADATCLPRLPAALSEPVTEDDFDTEFLCHTMAVKAVASVQEAIDHINSHSSGHTESVVTEDPVIAETFLSRIDSAGVYHNCSTRFADGFRYGFGAEVGISTNRRIDSAGVYHNCSTRFADGFRYGFGAEVGISTNRIHARGLVIHKYRMYGAGHTAAEFSGTSPEHAFVHAPDQEPVSWPAIALMISQSRERLEQAAVAKEARNQAHAARKFM
eukprot:s3_g18.t4